MKFPGGSIATALLLSALGLPACDRRDPAPLGGQDQEAADFAWQLPEVAAAHVDSADDPAARALLFTTRDLDGGIGDEDAGARGTEDADNAEDAEDMR